MKNNLTIILIVAMLCGIAGLGVFFFYKKPTNIVIDSPTSVQKPTVVYINDSLKVQKQEMLLTQSKKLIEKLQDSIENLASKATKLSPETLIKYNQLAKYENIVGTYKDSLSSLIDSLIKFKSEPNYKEDYIKLLTKKIPYELQDKWFSQSGYFDLNGNIVIKNLVAKSSPYILLGETGKWYQRKTVTAVVGDKNPHVEIDSLQTFKYVPKDKLQFSLGPVVLTDGKSTTFGAGISLKKSIFSLTIGYQITKQ